MAWITYNANPCNNRVGDCVVRAISLAENEEWEDVYISLCVYGLMCCDMPSANLVWGKYLKDKGYRRQAVENEEGTVSDFCKEHEKGTYLLALSGHLLCVIDGDYYDTWNSGDEIPLFYWEKE